MTKKIFQDSFLISGIMCFENCGSSISNTLKTDLNDLLQSLDAQLILDAEPQALGVHRITITITSNKQAPPTQEIYQQVKAALDATGYELLANEQTNNKNELEKSNGLNILINMLATGAIFALSIIFPPSILLTVGLTALSFVTTAFTARKYLLDFLKNLSKQNPTNMTTTVSLGWGLSLVHTLYHTITMPLASSFSMVFMCFVMPILLISVINIMDEIKRQVMKKSAKMHLQGIQMLFPQMAEEYDCYDELLPQAGDALSIDLLQLVNQITQRNSLIKESKNTLKQGMLIRVKAGECFPVDCILAQGNTIVDASLLTGEPQQAKHPKDSIPAGAINLGSPVVVYAKKDSYNSTINALLFRTHRLPKTSATQASTQFTYLYTSLIVVGIATSLLAPLALGILTAPLLLQNITGILFAVCPCTMAIAAQLPNLLNLYQRSNKGITIRNETLCQQTDEIHTIVFDKTGTLTTGKSQVQSYEGHISPELWYRIYLLEQKHGKEHPLAKAITLYYRTHLNHASFFEDITPASHDPNNRGLSATVQGRIIHIGSAEYLQEANIKQLPEPNNHKLSQGLTAVYIAEDHIYKGVIYIKHEIRKEILSALTRLKREGKKIIMLTGDTHASAMGFNIQNGNLFEAKHIKAGQDPKAKEDYVEQLMNEADPKGIWFIGDGLNDAPCARMVSDKGGVSCAMTANDKTSFFTDISLNGSLNYLFAHHNLNQFLQKNIFQNQGLLIYGALAFIAFIISFSIANIAVSPIIPLLVMASTTLMVLFNSYRVQLTIDCSLEPNPSWLKQILASDASLGLLVGASMLFMCSLLISTVATGGLALPAIAFTAGATTAISSICLFTAEVLLGVFSALTATYLVADKAFTSPQNVVIPAQAGNHPPLSSSPCLMDSSSPTWERKTQLWSGIRTEKKRDNEEDRTASYAVR